MALKRNSSKIDEKVENSDLLKVKPKLPEASGKQANISFKIPIEHKEIFDNLFKEIGVTFSSGIRMIIYKYLKDNNIKY